MARYIYAVDAQGKVKWAQFATPDYVLKPGELEGDGDALPKITPVVQPVTLTVDDIVAVLSPQQQAALQAKVSARKS